MTADEILTVLAKGPRIGFGSERDTDQALQSLRKAGTIRYVKRSEGGSGWELVTPTAPTQPAPPESPDAP